MATRAASPLASEQSQRCLIVRRSRAAYNALANDDGRLVQMRTRLPQLAPFGLLALLVVVVRAATMPGGVFLAGIALGLFGISLAVVLPLAIRELTFRNTSIRISPDRLMYRNFLGFERSFDRVALDHVILRSVDGMLGRHPIALFVSRRRTVLFRLWTEIWDGLELHDAFVALDVPTEGKWRAIGNWHLRKEAKHALPLWWWCNSNPFVLIVVSLISGFTAFIAILGVIAITRR